MKKMDRLFWILFALLLCERTKAERISEKMCRNYAGLVNSTESLPDSADNKIEVDESKCQIKESSFGDGGSATTNSGEFPHMVSIGYGKKLKIAWGCGGSLISDMYVLTSAQCLTVPGRGPALKVRAGTINLKRPEPSYQDRDVVERIKNPHYKKPIRHHDAGLLKVDKPFVMNYKLRPACLEVERKLGARIIATAYAKTSPDNKNNFNELRKIELDIIPNDTCNKTWSKPGNQLPGGISSSMICAGLIDSDKDACQADSGGAIQRRIDEPACMYSVAGVTSFGNPCGEKEMPAVYTRVSAYIDWIESVVWPDQ